MTADTLRLSIRPLADRDASFILTLLNDSDFLRYIGDKGVRTPDDALRYIDEGPRAMYARFGFGLDLVSLREGSIPIGICGLLKRDALPDPDIGFAYLSAYCGRGYGREAAAACLDHARDALSLRRVLAITSPDNGRSIRLLHRLGFYLERRVPLAAGEADVNVYACDLTAATAPER